MPKYDFDIEDELAGLLIPWHWSMVKMSVYPDSAELFEWTKLHDIKYGYDYQVSTSDESVTSPDYRWPIKRRVHYFLFKNSQDAIMFKLRFGING